MNSDVWVVVPVYNETQIIGRVIKSLAGNFSNIVCVDDGSSDNSAAEIIKAGASLVRHPINLGYGAALQTGTEYALQDSNAKYFATFDSDGQHRVEDLSQMLKTIRHKDLDIVLGSRFLGKAENVPQLKKMILKAAVRFMNLTSGIKLTDAHNGLRLFDRQVAESLRTASSDFSYASEVIEIIAKNKYKYQEVPVTIKYTDYSNNKGQSVFNAINMGLDTLLDRLIK